MQRNKRLMKLKKRRDAERKQAKVRERIEAAEAHREELSPPQCSAKLKSGKRCKRQASRKIKGQWYCWQHGEKK